MKNQEILNKIQQIAEEVGFDLMGVAEVNPPVGGEEGKENSEKLDEWVKNGYYGEMKWFADSLEKRKDILKVMSDAKGVICVAMNYCCGTENKKDAKSAISHSHAIAYECEIRNSGGKIARYAQGRDYHKIFDKKLKLFSQKLKEIFSNGEFKYYSDTGPVLERMWAVKSGLGFVGKNTNLITKYGSWVLLGEIITNVELKSPWQSFSHQLGGDLTPPALDKCFAPLRTNSTSPLNDSKKTAKEISQQNKVGCGDCRRCLDACPTGALVALPAMPTGRQAGRQAGRHGPYTVDARKCISYLTIEYKGEIPVELREKMGNRIFGCDACQEVCPFNIGRQKEAKNELTEKVIACLPVGTAGTTRDLKEILSIKTDEEFLEKFAGSPLMRAKRRGLVRNACIAAGNSGDRSMLPYLKECLSDKEPIIASHAKWAIEEIEKMVK